MDDPRIETPQADLLMRSVLTLESPEEAYRYFQDLMTVSEIKSLATRLEVAVMLRRKVTYQEIARRTGASTATVSRVNRALYYGADGYLSVLDKLEKQGLIPPADGEEKRNESE
ncbi:MAG: hypothetical protein IKP40_08345 [Clostridia bacterium]|nr:hypothetical protein [Clostridia bacterium]